MKKNIFVSLLLTMALAQGLFAQSCTDADVMAIKGNWEFEENKYYKP